MHEEIQRELTDRYRQARRFYEQPGVRDAALLFRIGYREYCDRFVHDNFPPLTWTAASNDGWEPDADAAYRDAGRE